jgi:hypothetical protein
VFLFIVTNTAGLIAMMSAMGSPLEELEKKRVLSNPHWNFFCASASKTTDNNRSMRGFLKSSFIFKQISVRDFFLGIKPYLCGLKNRIKLTFIICQI